MSANISIITPSFNRESYVSETLDSLLKQTYSQWESIVVDDGSTDNTKSIVSNYSLKDSRIKLFDREFDSRPKGACACRNQGVDISSGEYLIFLDTDDLLEPFCLEQRVRVMEENKDLDFAIFPSLMFRHKPNDLGLWWNSDKKTDELTRQFHQDAICQGTGVIWRKSSFIKIGQWDEALHLWQDIDLFFRAYIQGYRYKKFFDFPPDLHNRRLETSISRHAFFDFYKTQSRIEVVQRAVNLLKKYRKYHYISEAKYMLAEIISALSRCGNSGKGNELIKWGVQEAVFNSKEARDLQCMVWFRKMKLNKLSIFANIINRIESDFTVKDCTLGTLHHKHM